MSDPSDWREIVRAAGKDPEEVIQGVGSALVWPYDDGAPGIIALAPPYANQITAEATAVLFALAPVFAALVAAERERCAVLSETLHSDALTIDASLMERDLPARCIIPDGATIAAAIRAGPSHE